METEKTALTGLTNNQLDSLATKLNETFFISKEEFVEVYKEWIKLQEPFVFLPDSVFDFGWDSAPDWANYQSQDMDGEWYWHQFKPRLGTNEWIPNGKIKSCRQPQENWELSLRVRQPRLVMEGQIWKCDTSDENKNGFKIHNLCKTLWDNQWIESVVYQSLDDDALYSRTLENFLNNFTMVLTE
jgi:hypothetical protein